MDRFKPEERGIFLWHDGTQERASDPLQIERDLHKAEPDIAALWKPIVAFHGARDLREKFPAETADGDKVFGDLKDKALSAGYAIAAAVRKAFGVPEPAIVDGRAVGMSGKDCVRLLNAYNAFMRELEDAARPLPSSPAPTGAPASAGSATASSSACTPAAAS